MHQTQQTQPVSAEIVTAVDWYDQQTLGLENSTVFWKSLAPRPTTNKYVSDRGGKNDGIHVAVVDDLGTITGIQGNILEKFTGLSKAKDAISNVNSPEKIYYKDFIAKEQRISMLDLIHHNLKIHSITHSQ